MTGIWNATPLTMSNPEGRAIPHSVPRLAPRPEQFETLTMPHLRPVYQAAFALLPSQRLAEQAAEATFAAAWTGRRDMGADVRLWLFSLLIPEIRQRRGWFRLPAWGGRADAALAGLRSLPIEQAEAVLLADVEEFSEAEIATIAGSDVQAVERWLALGRARLERIENAT